MQRVRRNITKRLKVSDNFINLINKSENIQDKIELIGLKSILKYNNPLKNREYIDDVKTTILSIDNGKKPKIGLRKRRSRRIVYLKTVANKITTNSKIRVKNDKIIQILSKKPRFRRLRNILKSGPKYHPYKKSLYKRKIKNIRRIRRLKRYKRNLRKFIISRGRNQSDYKQFIDKLVTSKTRRLKRKMKRYPLFLYSFLLKYKYGFVLPPTTKKFHLLKTIIVGFRWILHNSIKVKFFFFTMFRQLLVSLFSLPLYVPKFFIVRMLNLLLIKEFSYRHLNIHYFRKIMNSRYIIFQSAHAAIRNSINSFDKFNKIRSNFFGMHTKNITSSLICNYICHKLGQYFSIQQILGPVLRDLRRSPLLQGFKIVVAGRLTRKERAAFMVRKNGRVSLSQKSAIIDFSSQFKIMRFGMVGVKVWFMRKNIFYKPYMYRLSMMILPLLTKRKKYKYKKVIKSQRRYMHKAPFNYVNDIIIRGKPMLRRYYEGRGMSTLAAVKRKSFVKMHTLKLFMKMVFQYILVMTVVDINTYLLLI